MYRYAASVLIIILQILQALIVLTAKQDTRACFDVLDKLLRYEVRVIYFMNFNQIAHTQPAADISTCFLHATHPADKSIIQQYFDVYNKCDTFKARNFEPFGNQQLEELVDLGLPYNLEMDLRKIMETGSKKELEGYIIHVQVIMSNKIELSAEYKHYKESILRKITPNKCENSSPIKDINSCSRDNLLKILSKEGVLLYT